MLQQDDFLEYATMLVTNCWSEEPGVFRDARCPEIGTGAAGATDLP